MRAALLVGMALFSLGTEAPVGAHHSVANFDFTRSATITCTVTYFSFTNPHSFIDVEVQDANGERRAYKIFTVARVVMMRTGWALDDLRAGDEVTITGSPDRRNPGYLYLRRIVFANGRVWDFDPALQN